MPRELVGYGLVPPKKLRLLQKRAYIGTLNIAHGLMDINSEPMNTSVVTKFLS